MNIPENYFEKLIGLNEEVNEAFKGLNCLQSALDRKISDIYHDIERSEFDIAQGNEYAKQLKETLQFRRVIKDELAKLMRFIICCGQRSAKLTNNMIVPCEKATS